MDTQLYVSNLPYSTTEATLRQLFGQVGHVTSVTLIQDQEHGQSKGFAFVTLSTLAEAQNAISQFNDSRLAGRTLTVTMAKPKAMPNIYQSQLSAFALAGHGPTKVTPLQRPATPGGYQSRLSAFGTGSAPLAPRRRGRSQRH